MLDTYRYKVDFTEVKYYIEIHEVLKRDLDFPDYYGGNIDALWDCLTDQLLSGLTYIEIRGFENIRRKFRTEAESIFKLLHETKHAYNNKYSDRFFVTLIHEDGTLEKLT